MTETFGIIGVFDRPEAIKDAAQHLRSLGFRAIEAYTPYPVKELDQVLRPRREVMLPLIMFGAAAVGGAWGYFIQAWDEALNYPINVGGRPHNSWPAFIVGNLRIYVAGHDRGGLVRAVGVVPSAAPLPSDFQRRGIRARFGRSFCVVRRGARSKL